MPVPLKRLLRWKCSESQIAELETKTRPGSRGNGSKSPRSNSRRRLHRLQWLLRRRQKLLRCELRRRRRAGQNGLAYGRSFEPVFTPNEHTQDSFRENEDQSLNIELPEKLDFEENYETTVSHLQIVRLAARGKLRLKELKFEKLRFISPSAALVLATEVDRWNQRVKGRLRAKPELWSEDITRLLCEMGYFELLKIQRPSAIVPYKSTSFLPFIRGTVRIDDGGQLAKRLRIQIEKLIGVSINRQSLFQGLSEAITNVSHHAYSFGTPLRQWWVSASYTSWLN